MGYEVNASNNRRMKKPLMRNTCFKATLLGFALAAGMGGLSPAHAQTNPITLVSWTNDWRYWDYGTNFGTLNWKTNSYSDASWMGPLPGLFGYESATAPYDPYGGIRSGLSLYVNGAGSGNQVTSYYFRTTFTWNGSSNPTNCYLVASNAVDDGVFVYLNGMPLYGFRVTANASATSFASGQPATEGVNEVTNLRPTYLRQGLNLLAAEVHQNAATSTDVVFGLDLVAVPYIPLTITTQPRSTNTVAGGSASISVAVNGNVPYYLWYKVTTNSAGRNVTNLYVGGSTNTTLNFPTVQLTNTGTYYVVVTNPVSRVQSASAVFTVKYDPIQILKEPLDLDLLAGAATNLSITVTGSLPSIRWYKIVNATSNSYVSASNPYTFTANATATPGSYFCVVTNGLSSVTSRVARVRVIPDTFGPMLSKAAVINYSTNVLLLTFNTRVITNRDPFSPLFAYSAWNIDNYNLTVWTNYTNPVVLKQVTNVVGGTNVYLQLGDGLSWNRSTNYMLTVNNIADQAGTNVMAPNSWIPVTFVDTNVLVPFGTVAWNFFAMTWSLDDFTNSVTTNWTKNTFNDSKWGNGFGYFWFNDAGPFPLTCDTEGSMLVDGVITTYFRTDFTMPTTTGASNITATFKWLVDDGAVFYLNGTELFRVNMPAGTPAWNTYASASLDANCASTAATTYTTNLGTLLKPLANANTLAVELHQANDAAHDSTFDVQLTLTYERGVRWPTESTNNIRLLSTFDRPNDTVTLWWTNTLHNLTIEEADALDGPWFQAQPAATNMVFPMTNAPRFFQLQQYK
jgi:hypothetical protein